MPLNGIEQTINAEICHLKAEICPIIELSKSKVDKQKNPACSDHAFIMVIKVNLVFHTNDL